MDRLTKREDLFKTVDMSITSPRNALCMNRIYREVLDSGSSLSQTTDTNTKYWAEGMCVTDDDKLIYALYNGYKYTDDVLLKEIKISTGEILRTATLPLGHCNSLEFNPKTNKLYSAYVSTNSNGGSTNISKVSIIDYTSLTVDTIKDFTSELYVTSVSYDRKNDETYLSNGHSIYRWNLNNDTVTLKCNFKEEITGAFVQSEKVCNGIVYSLRHNPSYIACYDLDGNLLKTLNIPTYFGYYCVGEVEDLSFSTSDDGTFYLISQAVEQYEITVMPQIFRGNIYKGDYNSQINSYSISPLNTIYVDITSTFVNPDGSSAKPFKELCEAIMYLNCPFVNAKTISVATGTYAFTYINKLTVEIEFNNASVYGMVARGGNVYLSAPKFLNNKATGRALTLYRNCNVRVWQPTFQDFNTDFLISNTYSNLFLSGTATFNNCTYTYVVENNSSNPVNCSKTDTSITVKDMVSGSNGTPKQFSCSLSATNSTFNFDNGVVYGLTNKIYKRIRFLYSYGNIKQSVDMPINDTTLAGTHQLYLSWYSSNLVNIGHIDVAFTKNESNNITGIKISDNTVATFNGSTWNYTSDSTSLSVYGIILE